MTNNRAAKLAGKTLLYALLVAGALIMLLPLAWMFPLNLLVK